jgi:predicted O-methyltransferase YrrM
VRVERGTVAGGFDAAWSAADPIPGWLTRAQGRALWNAATQVEPGDVVVEIGSHQGRSTVVLASAAAARGATVVAVDPFVDGAMFGGAATRTRFERHIREAGLQATVRLVSERSSEVLGRWDGPVAVVYVDGKHDYWSCTRDLGWAVHVRSGGRVLVHDAFSSVGVTLGVLREQLRRRPGLRYLGRSGSLAEFAVGPPSVRDRAAVARQLPWFGRNLVVKLARRLRLRPVLAALGHRSPYDPF